MNRPVSFLLGSATFLVSVFAHSGPGSVTFDYDDQGRLDFASYGNTSQIRYYYDKEGNRESTDWVAILVDTDGDGIADSNDNCPSFKNVTQENSNNDLLGDLCDVYLNSDFDQLPDAWEMAHFGNLTQSNGSGDADGDGLTDAYEYQAGTNPNSPFHVVADRILLRHSQTVFISEKVLLANDFNPLDVAISISSVTKTGSGTPTKLVDSVRYKPLVGFIGDDNFTYSILGNTKTESGVAYTTMFPATGDMNGSGADEIVIGAGTGETINPAGGNDIYLDIAGPDKIRFGKNEGDDSWFLSNRALDNSVVLKPGVQIGDIRFEHVLDDLVMYFASDNGTVSFMDGRKDPEAFIPGSLVYSDQTIQTAIGINDYIVRAAPPCQDGSGACVDNQRDPLVILPGELLGNDIGQGTGHINTSTFQATNITGSPEYIENCGGTDCFKMSVANFDYPVNITYDLIDDGTVSGKVNARYTLVKSNTFNGTEKNESIYGGDVTGDLIYSGGGNDLIAGGGGNDFVYLRVGDDHDTLQIIDWSQSSDRVIVRAPLTYAPALPSLKEVVLQRSGLGLLVKSVDEKESLLVDLLFANSSMLNLANFDRIVFADGSRSPILASEIPALATYGATLQGTLENDGRDKVVDDTLAGTSSDDVIFGHAGNDTISGGGGNDILYGGAGNDTLRAGSGNNYDYLYGDDGDDTLIGGGLQGVFMWGGAGRDRYNIGLNSALVTIGNLDTTTCASGCTYDKDYVSFGSGLSDAMVKFGRKDDSFSFIASNGSSSSTTTIPGYFSSEFFDLDFYFTDSVNGSTGNPKIWDGTCVDYDANATTDNLLALVDADQNGAPDTARVDYDASRPGTSLDTGCARNRLLRDLSTDNADQIVAFGSNDWINARAGDDTVDAGDGNDVVYGGSGHDTLDGSWGDDVLFGEAGNDLLLPGSWSSDRLIGGEGSDTYRIPPDAPQVIVADGDLVNPAAETDIVEFPVGVPANKLWFYVDDTDSDGANDDLVIQVIGGIGKTVVENWGMSRNAIEQYKTSVGACTMLRKSMVSGLLLVMPPKASPPSSAFTDAFIAPYWEGNGC